MKLVETAEVIDIRAVKNIRKAIKEISKHTFKPDGLTLNIRSRFSYIELTLN
jgi:hypothetical protein